MAVKEKKQEKALVRISQSDVPSLRLEQAEKLAQALWDNFAGKSAAPHNIAMALDLSPTSSGWRVLCGASIAYGLTEGGYNAASILLTPLGKRVVAPTREGDDIAARREASLRPRLPSDFFTQYDRAKFPKDDIAANVLVGMGMPKERAPELVDLLKVNGKYVGIIKETKTGLFVALDALDEGVVPEVDDDLPAPPPDRVDTFMMSQRPVAPNNRVFITHGKNTKIMEQVRKLVALGGFEPVVAIEQQTAAKPLPSKVMDSMRECSAAVIHVGSEGVLTNKDGVELPHINPNVLIEIGASMALYDNRFILVVENGVDLPSNLHGLYQSRYSGDSIELDAGMKILEALRGLASL